MKKRILASNIGALPILQECPYNRSFCQRDGEQNDIREATSAVSVTALLLEK